jgi:protein NrfC
MKNPKGKNARITRRHFIKATGTIVLVAGSGWRLSGADEIPRSDGYLLVDIGKCQGCASCMLACSLVHEGVESLSLARIQVLQNAFDAFPEDVEIAPCRQCVDPPCVKVCPVDALTADAGHGHVRMVDKEKCIGCGACHEACPYKPGRAVVMADRTFAGKLKSRKCDLCANAPFHWDEAGGGPDGKQACVAVCPVDAIRLTKEIPVQAGDDGYRVNLRDEVWGKLGYPTRRTTSGGDKG